MIVVIIIIVINQSINQNTVNGHAALYRTEGRLNSGPPLGLRDDVANLRVLLRRAVKGDVLLASSPCYSTDCVASTTQRRRSNHRTCTSSVQGQPNRTERLQTTTSAQGQ